MKILHVIDDLSSGGAEKLLKDLAIEMSKGNKVSILLLDDKMNIKKNVEEIKNKGIKIFIVPIKKMKSIKNIYFIYRHIIKYKYDIVHAHLFPAFYWVSIVSMLYYRKKPVFVLTEHSTYNNRRKKFLFRFLEKIIYHNYDKVFSISKETQSALKEWLNVRENKKYQVVENGINLERFISTDKYSKVYLKSKLSNCEKFICMAGRFTAAKDHETLLKAMKYLDQNVGLFLLGEGELEERTKKMVCEMGLEDRVVFLGYRSDISVFLKSMDAVVVSSHWEGFGLVAVEAMAVGVPVIASDVPGLNTIVKNAGLLFEKSNEHSLAHNINKVLKDEDYYKYVAQRCSDRAKKYSIELTSNTYLLEYKVAFNHKN